MTNKNTQFKPGKSGNPAGRPRGSKNYATIRKEAVIELAKEYGKTPDEIDRYIIKQGIILASQGYFNFYKYDADRYYSKDLDKVEDLKEEARTLESDINGVKLELIAKGVAEELKKRIMEQ